MPVFSIVFKTSCPVPLVILWLSILSLGPRQSSISVSSKLHDELSESAQGFVYLGGHHSGQLAARWHSYSRDSSQLPGHEANSFAWFRVTGTAVVGVPLRASAWRRTTAVCDSGDVSTITFSARTESFFALDIYRRYQQDFSTVSHFNSCSWHGNGYVSDMRTQTNCSNGFRLKLQQDRVIFPRRQIFDLTLCKQDFLVVVRFPNKQTRSFS